MLAQGPIESKDGSEEVSHVSACLFYHKLIMSRPASFIGMAREVVAPLLLHSLRAQWFYPPFPFLDFKWSRLQKQAQQYYSLARPTPTEKFASNKQPASYPVILLKEVFAAPFF